MDNENVQQEVGVANGRDRNDVEMEGGGNNQGNGEVREEEPRQQRYRGTRAGWRVQEQRLANFLCEPNNATVVAKLLRLSYSCRGRGRGRGRARGARGWGQGARGRDREHPDNRADTRGRGRERPDNRTHRNTIPHDGNRNAKDPV